jgi:hypothetical protein
MSNQFHEVLRKHRALQVEDLKKRDSEFDAAIATEKRDGETPEQTTARMFSEDHDAVRKYYGLPAQESA